MSKYDVELDMKSENSASIILNMIQPGSTVVEFGCAEGRMTKYMKEILDCQVYIIEFDEEAFEKAMNYAVDGFRCDIEAFEWVEMFNSVPVDYVIFADVLEHLCNPEQVVERIYSMLPEQGQLLLSVPNLAHSAVILGLMKDRFTYRHEGLLDNTHIHFFTYYSLEEMLANSNFIPVDRSATYILPWNTELRDDLRGISLSVQNELAGKDYGVCYQFVYRCRKAEYVNKQSNKAVLVNDNIKKQYFHEKLKLYIANNGNFDEDHVVSVSIGMGENKVELDLTEYDNIEQMRLDITEDCCIIRLLDVVIDDLAINVQSLWGNYAYCNNDIFLFLNNDPYFHIKTEMSPKKVFIRFTVQRIIEESATKSMYRIFAENVQQLKADLDNAQSVIRSFQDKEKETNSMLQRKDQAYCALQQEYSLEKERLQSEIYLLHENCKTARNEYELLINSQFWKITKPFRMIVDVLKGRTKTDINSN